MIKEGGADVWWLGRGSRVRVGYFVVVMQVVDGNFESFLCL